MIVTHDNIDLVIEDILSNKLIGFDTETYGLAWGDRMFSMQIATEENAYYFNFHDYRDGTYVLDKYKTMVAMSKAFQMIGPTWFIHNAKFDLQRLWYECTEIGGDVHDTQVIERLLNNQLLKYDLASCLRRRKLGQKDNAVEKWISENKAYTMVKQEGKQKRTKVKHYDRVPFEIMYKYGLIDAERVRSLGVAQLEEFDANKMDTKLYHNELKLTKVLLKMECRGVLVDTNYAKQGWEHERKLRYGYESDLTRLGGSPFRSGPNWLRSVFDGHGVPYRTYPKTGNPVFDKHELERIEHPVANLVREHRRAEKYISTYYSDFVHAVDNAQCIHANVRQGGTDTGRFSYSNPNLQNVPKEEDFEKGAIQVRKCFIPREGYTFVAIDFSQQEFRLMLDYANERRVIRAVMEGEDLHQATANMVGVTRKQAKTLNFGLLYGMGVEKLAKQLKVSEREAGDTRLKYFSKLPRVENLISGVQSTAKRRKYIRTWANRILRFPNREWAYKAPNHLIQGGCGDIARFAMTEIDEYLEGKPAHMLIQVHDEIVFEIRDDALDIVPDLVEIMKRTYPPKNGMEMDCTVEMSKVSWGQQDMEEQ